jgi:segregation and condensation protein B
MVQTPLDTELEDLPPDLRWRHWMGRIEAVVFASAAPVPSATLQRVVGQGASLDLLIADIAADLENRPYELVRAADGWMMRTKAPFAAAIRAATEPDGRGAVFSQPEMEVLATIAYHQPISRAGLKEVFGKDISRDLIGRLHHRGLITTGPRAPRSGAPYTYVTTPAFLVTFDLQSLRDLPDMEQLEEAGLAGRGEN